MFVDLKQHLALPLIFFSLAPELKEFGGSAKMTSRKPGSLYTVMFQVGLEERQCEALFI